MKDTTFQSSVLVFFTSNKFFNSEQMAPQKKSTNYNLMLQLITNWLILLQLTECEYKQLRWIGERSSLQAPSSSLLLGRQLLRRLLRRLLLLRCLRLLLVFGGSVVELQRLPDLPVFLVDQLQSQRTIEGLRTEMGQTKLAK